MPKYIIRYLFENIVKADDMEHGQGIIDIEEIKEKEEE